jgi:4-carboxymuconolactone decarboxylase
MHPDDARAATVTQPAAADANIPALDDPTRALVRLAAIVAVGDEPAVRDAMAAAARDVPPTWVEELVLQSYLFAGFPRALNAAREWRRASGRAAPEADEGVDFARADVWRERGEVTCATVYGPFYEKLRVNIRDLHPALDAWMVVEGYGKVLARPALDLLRRELCIVATCAVARQDRQLHSHLHGALHAGASPREVRAALDAVADLCSPDDNRRYAGLLGRVLGK